MFLFLAGWLLSSAAAHAMTIEYSQLKKVRLPYGEEITITGKLDEIEIPFKADGRTESRKLNEVMTVTKVSLNYAGDQKEEGDKAGSITGNTWSVVTKKLAAGQSVGLIFRFSGQLKEEVVRRVIDRIFADPRYRAASDVALGSATSRDPLVQLKAARAFAQEVATLVQKNVSDKLVMAVKEPPVTLLTGLSNLPINYEDMVRNPVEGVKRGMAFSEAAAAVEAYFKKTMSLAGVPSREELDKLVEERKPTADARSRMNNAAIFHANYTGLSEDLRNLIFAEIEAADEEALAVDLKDFEKYAGLDYGAIYIPRMQALRHFVTANVYFGPVEDAPAPRQESQKPLGREWWRQRLSLSFGLCVGDISSQAGSNIKENNAFLYGLGFRLNKYFRLTLGAAAFRDQRNDGIRHGLMVGPSIDITAFRYVRGLFGKGE